MQQSHRNKCWAWISQNFNENAEAAGGLVIATIQIALMLGGFLGDFPLNHFGVHETYLAAAGWGLCAGLLIPQRRAAHARGGAR